MHKSRPTHTLGPQHLADSLRGGQEAAPKAAHAPFSKSSSSARHKPRRGTTSCLRGHFWLAKYYFWLPHLGAISPRARPHANDVPSIMCPEEKPELSWPVFLFRANSRPSFALSHHYHHAHHSRTPPAHTRTSTQRPGPFVKISSASLREKRAKLVAPNARFPARPTRDCYANGSSASSQTLALCAHASRTASSMSSLSSGPNLRWNFRGRAAGSAAGCVEAELQPLEQASPVRGAINAMFESEKGWRVEFTLSPGA